MRLEYAKNPVWVDENYTMIDLTIKWAEIDEELPFTASPDDCEAHGRAIFVAAVAGEYGSVAKYLPPPAPTPEELAAEVRAERNRLLAESDWTQMPDARAAMGEVKAAEWDTYRQALRDVPEQEGFPENVVWPTKPE
jgi:hypothetical protein